MARVLVATQPWGLLWEKDGNRNVKVPVAGQLAAINTTVYTAATGGTTISAPAFVTNADGELPGYVEEGDWTLTVNGESFPAAAVSGGIPGRVTAVENGSAWTGATAGDVLTYGTPPVWTPPGNGNLPLFLVDDYLTGGATDKGAATSALAAASASTTGGVVKFGPRSYALADWAPVLPTGTAKVIDLEGSGVLSTILNFTTDRGVGTWAIRADATGSAQCWSKISDMRIIGPSASTTLGVSPSDMRGIRQGRRMNLERLTISGFHSGVQVIGDHTRARDVNISNCYYGMYFAQMAGFFGDNHIENCDLAGTQYASIGIANDALASINMIGGHLGVGPHCIRTEAGSSAALSLGGATFLRVSFELAGNSWISSSDKTMRIDGVDFIGCGFTRSAATYKLGSEAADYGIYVAELYRCNFRGSTMRDAWAVAQIFATNVLAFDMDRASVAFTAVETAATTFMLASGTVHGCHVSGDKFKARGQRTGIAITKGQLVGRGVNLHYPNATGNGIVLEGVALNTTTAGNAISWACYEGQDIFTFAQTTLTANQSLVVNGTDRNKVSSEANTGAALTRQQVGMPYSGDGSTGSVQAVVRI